MDIKEWQKRLEDRFTVNGIVGGNLVNIFNQERACGEYFANTFRGKNVLIDSFQSFYIDSLNNAFDFVKNNGWPRECEYYPVILHQFLSIFKSFRACENLGPLYG